MMPGLARVQRGKITEKKYKWAKAITNKYKLAFMFVNELVSFEQLTGMLVKEDLEWKRLGENLKKSFIDYRKIEDFVNEKSVFMRSYNRERQFNLFEKESQPDYPTWVRTSKDLKIKKMYEGLKALDKLHFKLGYFLLSEAQSRVNYALWKSKYDQVMEHGEVYNGKVIFPGDENFAISQADSHVRRTQGSFAYQNVSSAQANIIVHAVVPFATWFVTMMNQTITRTDKIIRDRGLKLPVKNKEDDLYVGFLACGFISSESVDVSGVVR